MENQLMNILVQAILSVLGVLISYLVTVAVAYLTKKKDALIRQMGVDQYNATYNIAKGVFYIVEQQFKTVPNSSGQKAQAFNELLTRKVPGLTEEEIEHLREAIVGEINTQLNKSKLLKPAEVSKVESDGQ